MRGTENLSPEQKPTGMKMSRRAQPYRKTKKDRPMGPSLSAMLRGAPFGLPNPMDQQRQFLKRRGR